MQLISDWRKWPKFWSVQLNLLAGGLLLFAEEIVHGIFSIWPLVPAEIRSAIDPDVIEYIGIACIFLAAIARAVKQRKLAEDKADAAATR